VTATGTIWMASLNNSHDLFVPGGYHPHYGAALMSNPPLLLCCQSSVLNLDRMKTKPVPRPVYPPKLPGGERSWMGWGC
jgi:hypothetical protein